MVLQLATNDIDGVVLWMIAGFNKDTSYLGKCFKILVIVVLAASSA